MTHPIFPNAAPPPGALFDNAPTEAAREYAAAFGISEERTSMLLADATLPPAPLYRDYTDGVTAIWANGRTQRGRCRSDKVMTADAAIHALQHGALCVFVMAGDAEAVRGDGVDR